MSFRKDVGKRLDKLEITLEMVQRIFIQKDAEIQRLAKQNLDLMNRFMATKWDQYATMNPEHWKDTSVAVEVNGSPLTDISNAGEVLSDEDIGKQSS